MAIIPDTTRRIAEYQRLACDLFDRIQAMDVEINAHLVKGQLDRAIALGRKRDQLVAQRRSAYASIKQLKHAELLNPGLPRRRKSDLVTR